MANDKAIKVPAPYRHIYTRAENIILMNRKKDNDDFESSYIKDVKRSGCSNQYLNTYYTTINLDQIPQLIMMPLYELDAFLSEHENLIFDISDGESPSFKSKRERLRLEKYFGKLILEDDADNRCVL